MKNTIILLLLLVSFGHLHAQYNTNQNKFWAFGLGAGLDFSSGVPVVAPASIQTIEGSASVCDALGNVLFYTDGSTVFDRTGAVMPSGSIASGYSIGSTTQAAVVVPYFSDTNKYYLFSLGYPPSSGSRCGLIFCIADMARHGGLGDIIPSTIGTRLDTNLTEKMIAIPGPNCSEWLLVHSDTDRFLAYRISSAGISSAVVSHAGARSYLPSLGEMKCSHNYRKLVLQHSALSPASTELFDFDPATGIVSNGRVIDSNFRTYGAEFSPDDTRLYSSCGISTGSQIVQFDVTLATTAAIRASRTVVYTNPGLLYGSLKLGPDGRIYHSNPIAFKLDCVPFPNVLGTACGYLTGVVSYPPPTVRFGLPNVFYPMSSLLPTAITGVPALCVGAAATLSSGPAGGVWTSGAGIIATIGSASGIITGMSAGTSTITYAIYGGCRATLTETVYAMPVMSGPSSVCLQDSITILATAAIPGTWTSSNTAVATLSTLGVVAGISAGTAAITYAFPVLGCTATQTVTVNPLPVPVIYLLGTVLETGDHFYTSYQWYEGTTAIAGATTWSMTPTYDGTYSLSVTDTNGCTGYSTSVTVDIGTAMVPATDIKIGIYPNPASGVVNIAAPLDMRIAICSTDGKEVVSEQRVNAGQARISLPQLAKGLYFMVLYDDVGNRVGVRKLMVE